MPSKTQAITVVRKARKGRAVADSTIAARKTLTDLWKSGPRTPIVEVDDKGNEVRTYDAVVVTAESLGKPKGYTGMVGLISAWSKTAGPVVKGTATALEVRTSKVSDTQYAIRAK